MQCPQLFKEGNLTTKPFFNMTETPSVHFPFWMVDEKTCE